MKYSITDEVFNLLPEFHRGVVVALRVDNMDPAPELEHLLISESIRAAQSVGIDDPRLRAWDQAHLRFGANPKRDTPSIRFLHSRAMKGLYPKSISKLVNCMNIASLRWVTSCGGDDLGSLTGDDINLTISDGTECFSPLFKPEVVEHPATGEIIYSAAPSKRVMCRRLNWRNGHFSRIKLETTDIAINIDGLTSVISANEIQCATMELAELVRTHCGGTIFTQILNFSNRSFTV